MDGTEETQSKTARGALFSALLAVGLGLAACSSAASPATTFSPSATQEVSPTISLEQGSNQFIARGAQLYAASCQVCHGDQDGRGVTSGASTHNQTGHTWHHPDAQLKDWILNGKFPGAMPSFTGVLTEEEVDTILSHIKSWWTLDQLESQADISRRYQEALERQSQ